MTGDAHLMIDFDPEWASPSEWARMYRRVGLQVVPAPYPMRDKTDKRPALVKWREFQDRLVSDDLFQGWFPDGCKPNMGVITGAVSGRLMVIDLDDYKGGASGEWWRSVTSGLEPETPCQITGGGGRQFFFRVPDGFSISTHRTPIADIRCEGGFAMLPPSRHMSGKEYTWMPHRGIWECEVAEASRELCEAVIELIESHRGSASATATQRTENPATDFDSFGNRIDGREEYMRDVVWAAVLNLYRKTAGAVDEEIAKEAFEQALEVYLRGVRTRIPGVDNVEGLEKEGRGPSAFLSKWQTEMRKWNGKVAQEAAKESPRPFEAHVEDPTPEAFVEAVATAAAAPSTLFEFLDVAAIKTLPDPRWLVDGLVVEHALGFIFGPPGCGKTFVSLSMALSISTALDSWWGRPINRTGAVVYISSEGVSDLKFRIQAWEQANQVLADGGPFYLIRQSINFMKPEDVGTLLATVEAIKEVAGTDIVAVFVDTVSRVLPGADENLQKDMTLFISACDAVRQRFGATVIGVHHTSRQGTLRGSTVFDGAGDFLLQVEREQGEELGFITAQKIKAAQDGWKQPFKMQVTPCGDIGGHSSLVAMHSDEEPAHEPEKPNAWPDDMTLERILNDIDSAWAKGKPWSSHPNTAKEGRYAPAIIASEYGIKAKVARDIIEAWLMPDRYLAVEQCDGKTKMKGLKMLRRFKQ